MTRDLWVEIIEEMESRRQKGLLEYGKPVDGSDTEDWLKHAELEFLDGAVYCRGARVVVEGMRAEITRLRDKVNKLLDEIRSLKGEDTNNQT